MRKCKASVFGHRAFGYEGSLPYGRLHANGTDGIGRKHGVVQFRCDHCDEWYTVAQVHEHPEDLRAEQIQIKALTEALKEMVLNTKDDVPNSYLRLAGVTEEDREEWKRDVTAPMPPWAY
jgi:hypothetical protein